MNPLPSGGQPGGTRAALIDVFHRQRHWAEEQGLRLTPAGNRFLDRRDALFAGAIDVEVEQMLLEGAGGELDRIASLRSSSCLVLNVFGPWRQHPSVLARVLGVETQHAQVSFEQKMPTGLAGTPPHLDVLLDTPTLTIGIEAKFLEIYGRTPNSLSSSYFRPGVWGGLDACRRLAERIRDGDAMFQWLGAAQLLKHALGLSANRGNFRLMLVWYRVDHPVAVEIDREIRRFEDAVGHEIDFSAVTYQELIPRFDSTYEPLPGYYAYLANRYGLSTSGSGANRSVVNVRGGR